MMLKLGNFNHSTAALAQSVARLTVRNQTRNVIARAPANNIPVYTNHHDNVYQAVAGSSPACGFFFFFGSTINQLD